MKSNFKKVFSAFLLIAVVFGFITFSAGRTEAETEGSEIGLSASSSNDGKAELLNGKGHLLESFANLRVPTTAASESSEIRFVSTVAGLDCSAAGFELTANGKTERVYVSAAYGEITFGDTFYKASDLCRGSKFFITYALTNIPKSEFSSEISVRSFVVDGDGKISYGERSSKKVSDWFEQSISLVSSPDRTVYYLGSELDLSGAKISDDVSGNIVSVDASMISDVDFSTVGEKTVKIEYLGAETEFTVSVIEKTKDFSINGIFNSHMVLQRNANTPIFGLGTDGDEITVTFGEQTKSAIVENGKWQVSLDPTEANATAQTLVIKSSAENSVTAYEDILVGDVWLCSGQSNMFLRVGDIYPYAYDKDPFGDWGIIEQQYIKLDLYRAFHSNADNPLVRSCWQWPGHENVKSEHTSATPYEDILSRMDWVLCDDSDPDMLDLQSAYAVSFALNIAKETGVPVGVVCSAQGGTTIKEWLPIDGSTTSGIEYYMDGKNYKGNYYNTMIAPMMPFAFRGILWWQGESDALKYDYDAFSSFSPDEDADRYGEYLEKLVSTYRSGFTACDDGSMPFIQSAIVYCNVSGIDNLRAAWQTFHDRQVSGNYTENISEAYTVNLWRFWCFGQADNVHSPRKWESGESAAKTALTNFYDK